MQGWKWGGNEDERWGGLQRGEEKCFGCKQKATERHREGRGGGDGQRKADSAEWGADGSKTPSLSPPVWFD